ncbi:MAG TPA: SWIM zinc finger family protein, partial [Blastocatellia bacterium]|nr:SWIM zinc finger family protein [Blastocatellia bacterium]
MSLTSILASTTKPTEQQRGFALVREGRVNVVAGQGGGVRGTTTDDGKTCFQVLVLNMDSLFVWCSCASFPQTNCRHLVAVTFSAEQKGYLHKQNTRHLSIERLGVDSPNDPPQLTVPVVSPESPRATTKVKVTSPKPDPRSQWKERLFAMAQDMSGREREQGWPASRKIVYLVGPANIAPSYPYHRAVTHDSEEVPLAVSIEYIEPKLDGQFSRPRNKGMRDLKTSMLPEPIDRELVTLLAAAPANADPQSRYGHGYRYRSSYYAPPQFQTRFRLNYEAAAALLPRLCATGRCLTKDETQEWVQLKWDDGEPWRVHVRVEPKSGNYVMSADLRRGTGRQTLKAPSFITAGGLVQFGQTIGPLEDGGVFPWIKF